MNKDTEIYGVDISKDVFDVFSTKAGHLHNINSYNKKKIK